MNKDEQIKQLKAELEEALDKVELLEEAEEALQEELRSTHRLYRARIKELEQQYNP